MKFRTIKPLNLGGFFLLLSLNIATALDVTVGPQFDDEDCSPPARNIKCDCDATSLTCIGKYDEYIDIVRHANEISKKDFGENLFSVNITVENLDLIENSTFENVKFVFLKLSSGLRHLEDNLFSETADTLRVLNLSSNSFEIIPAGALSKLNQLEILDLSHNDIGTLKENDFKGLDNLKVLNLTHNNIKVLKPEFFSNLSLLGVLQLDENNLSDLQNVQINSSTLKVLSLQNCMIQGELKIDSLKELTGLTSVDLSYNNITEVESQALSALPQLEFLNLGYNNIETLEENAFSELFNLIELDLQNNNIKLIHKAAFYNLTKLRNLNLASNNLQAFICEYSADFLSLESIYLENNSIKVISSGSFIYSQNLTELKLNGNELQCDCLLHDFSEYLMHGTPYLKEDLSTIKCSSPSALQGKSVSEVDYSVTDCHRGTPCKSPSIVDPDDDEDSTTIPAIVYSNVNVDNITDSTTESDFHTPGTITSVYLNNSNITESTTESTFATICNVTCGERNGLNSTAVSLTPDTDSPDDMLLHSSETAIVFNITHLSIKNVGVVSAVIEWSVNQEEEHVNCTLTLSIKLNSKIKEEKKFSCRNGNYSMNTTEKGFNFEICISSNHTSYDADPVCEHYRSLANTDYRIVTMIGMLTCVLLFIPLLVVIAFILRRNAGAYRVSKLNRTAIPLSGNPDIQTRE